MPYGLIYLATNCKNELRYIGQTTVTLSKRRQKHIDAVNAGDDSYVHNAMRAYTVEAFEFIEIDSADSQDELDYLERYWIRFHQTRDRTKGYNTKDGGKAGGLLNEEIKLKIGKANIGKKRTAESRAKMSARKKGIPNLAHSMRMKELYKKRPSWWTGRFHMETTKQLLREKNRGQSRSPATQYPAVHLKCLETNEIFPSSSAAARHLGKSVSAFSCLKKYPQRLVGGYHWIRLIDQ